MPKPEDLKPRYRPRQTNDPLNETAAYIGILRYSLTGEEEATYEKQFKPEFQLLDFLVAAADVGYEIRVHFNRSTSAYTAVAYGKYRWSVNPGMMLTAFSDDAEDSLCLLMYKMARLGNSSWEFLFYENRNDSRRRG